MELLDRLEQRVNALLEKVQALTAENLALKEAQAQELASLAEENHSLRGELEQERGLRGTALARIEALAARIKEHTGQE